MASSTDVDLSSGYKKNGASAVFSLYLRKGVLEAEKHVTRPWKSRESDARRCVEGQVPLETAQTLNAG